MQLLTSAARVASGSQVLSGFDWSSVQTAALVLDVTVAGSQAGDLLDVYLQSAPGDGATWDDFAHFTQVLGNGGAKKFIAWWTRDVTPEAEIAAPVDATMAVGVKQGPIGSDVRVKWLIVNGGGTHSFTFTLSIDANRS